MFEVVLTYRDFTEKAVDRYATAEEARTVAERISARCPEQVIRAWVREIREAKTEHP